MEDDSTRTVGGAERLEDGIEASIGPYKLLGRLGEGGFGIVYLAEQRSPIVRRVALKIIKHGMDTSQVIARFAAERQALAMMDHPNISTVLDAGATPQGRPYFVMELVHGEPITEYCTRHTLDTRARLALFVPVCQAVQHAHQKGIVHRDLKPGNVLVAVVDGKPVPKVIDFGIAKATITPLTDKTVYTAQFQAIGTPEYMSPEQAEMSGLDVDTRADVYSLGVLVYELLTGTTPFESRRLREASWDEARRIIREVPAPRPSTRVNESASIRGDLDWIVMKCLEKDRTRRYSAASELALDIERHLTGEPVLAAPPSALYRLQKFASRNRAAVIASAAIVALLVAGIAGTTFGLLRAQARRAEADAARRESQSQKETAEQVLSVFQQMLKGIKAEVARGRDTALLKEILDKTRDRVEAGEFRNRPVVELTLRQTLGLAYLDVGDYTTAQRVLSQALRLAKETNLGDVKPLATATTNLAGVAFEAGRPREAEELFRSALELLRRQSKDDREDIANALNNHASSLEQLGRLSDAVPVHREALAMYQRLFKGDREEIANTEASLAFALQQLGQFAEAERLHREALDMRRRLYAGPNSKIAISANNLAMLLGTVGRDEEAERLYRESLAIRRQLYQGDHASIASGLANVGFALNRRGSFAEAEQLYREALAMRRRLFTGDHPDVAINLDNLASTLRMQTRAGEAMPFARQALAMGRRLYQGDHPSLALTMTNTATTLLALDAKAEAEAMARDAVAMVRRMFKADHPSTARCLDTLANVLRAAHKDEAETIAREALAMRQRLFTGDHRDVAQSLHTLALVRAVAHAAEAQPLAEQALAMGQRTLAAGHPFLRDYEATLALARREARTAVRAQ